MYTTTPESEVRANAPVSEHRTHARVSRVVFFDDSHGHAKTVRTQRRTREVATGAGGGGEREAKVRYGHIRHQIRYLCRNLLSTKPVSKFLRNDTHGGHARSTRACGGGVLDIMLGRSRMVIDPRISTMPGRSTSSLHRPGRLCLHLARSAVRRSASRMKGKLHPVDPKNRL